MDMKEQPEDVVKGARNAECNAVAREIARLLLTPVDILGGPLGDHQFTFADVLRMAATSLGALNKQILDWTTQEKNRQFLERIHAAAHNPDDLYEFLRDRLMEGTEPLEELHAATALIRPLIADRDAATRFLRQRIDENLGKTRQGRPSRFRSGRDAEPFLELSTRLFAPCRDLVDLQTHFPDKSLPDLIAFVAGSSPDNFRLLKLHEKTIQQVRNSPSYISGKAAKTKARRLADAIAGKEMFGWKPGYSSERGYEFRRLKARNKQG